MMRIDRWKKTRAMAGAVIVGLLLASSRSGAQAPDTTTRLQVRPDRADWRYATGDTARFTVSLTRDGRVIPGVGIRIEIGPERLQPFRRDSLISGTGDQTLKVSSLRPGFLRVAASATVGSMTYRGAAAAAFSPEKIRATTTMPDDFQSFWDRTVASVRGIPLAPAMTKVARWSSADVDVYHISFQNDRVGSRLYGMLSIPTRAGKFPAVLSVPGAGVRPYFPDTALARRGIIHLRIGIHGIPVDRDSLLYNELRATALARYWSFGIESRDTYYYKRVFVGVVRAGDLIFSLPQFDGRNYVVQGGSQGGGLAIVAGVLDRRVKAIAVAYPAMADHFGYLENQPGGWPHIFADTVGMRAIPEKMETLQYYDVVNFARVLQVPGFYTWGYNDLTVPPTSAYAAYNLIRAPKELFIVPETAHFTVKAQDERVRSWILERLSSATPGKRTTEERQ